MPVGRVGRECSHQGCDNHDCRTQRKHSSTVFRRPTAPDQQKIGGDHTLDHRGVSEPVAHCLLVKMPAMRFPNALTGQQPAKESDGGVREEVERQN